MATAEQIGAYAWAAGLRRPDKLATAIAVSIAESGGDPSKVGDLSLQDAKWGPSIGLWQIRSLKAENGKGTVRDGSKLKDPLFNAKSMVSISGSGSNWDAWSVTHPIDDPAGYARYTAAKLRAAQAAQAVVLTGGAIAGVEAVGDGVEAVKDGLDSIQQVGEAIKDAALVPVAFLKWGTDTGTVKRFAFGSIGLTLLVIGATIFARPVMRNTVKSGVALVKGKGGK